MSDGLLQDWLNTCGLESLHGVFVAQDVTLDVLGDLSEGDLRELGLSLGMRRRLRKALGTHPPVANPSKAPSGEVLEEPADTEAQRRRITVVFIDLVGSTALSARMDPEELREHINAFQERISDVVGRYGGFVARFMGDGLLAYFGYPVAHEDDAARAVRAGLDAVATVGKLSTEAGPARARVGIASGLVVVGDIISAGETRERSVVGETPNLAARLQGIAAPGQVVVASSTRRLVGDAFSFAALPSLALKGFEESVTAYLAGESHTDATRFGARGNATLTPMQGRDMELFLLQERWELARGGEGQAVLLVGEAGIGKSRITHALIEQVKAEHHRCLINQCSPLHLDSPLWPVLEQIRSAARAGGDHESSSRLHQLMARSGDTTPEGLALITEALGLSPPPGQANEEIPAQQKRLRLLQALVDRLLGLARRGPLLVVMEDVHWVDPTTKDLLDAALGAIGDAQIMLLMTTRPESSPELARHAFVTTLVLNRLSRQAVQGIIRNVAGDTGIADELLGGIVNRTDGVPLFVEELTKAVLETGSHASSPQQAPAAALFGATIPDTLHDSLMARLDRVPSAKRVAQVAACIGRDFDYALLESVCRMPGAELAYALGGLVEAGLVFQHGRPPAARYTFKHALVRDAAYESMLNARCAEVHARIADLLESADRPAPRELVALHAAHAGDNERAITAYLEAGQGAVKASANAEAVSHYRQALQLLLRLTGGTDRDERELTILQFLGVPLIAVRGYASSEVEQVFQRARDLCEARAITDSRRFTVLRGLWNCRYDRSELEESAFLASTLVEIASTHEDPVELALAYRALGSTDLVRGDLARAADAFDKVLGSPEGWSTPESRVVHGEAPEVVSRQYAGWTATVAGRPDTGIALVEEGLAHARDIKLPIAIAFSLAILELTHWLRGDAQRCAQTSRETRALCAEQGFPFWQAHSELFAGWAQAKTEPNLQALAQTRAGLDAWIRTGAMLHVPTWSCVLAEVALLCGELDEAEAVLERGRSLAQRNGEVFMLPELLRLSAELTLSKGDAAAARALLERALGMTQQHGSHWIGLRVATTLARCLEAEDQASVALTLVEAAMDQVPEGRGCESFEVAVALRDSLRAAPAPRSSTTGGVTRPHDGR